MTTSKMILEIPDTNPAVLAGRIKTGIEVCNTKWQKIRQSAEPFPQAMQDNLDENVRRLNLLIAVGHDYGVDQCVFGQCKWDNEKFICFGCSKSNGKNPLEIKNEGG